MMRLLLGLGGVGGGISRLVFVGEMRFGGGGKEGRGMVGGAVRGTGFTMSWIMNFCPCSVGGVWGYVYLWVGVCFSHRDSS